MNAQQITIDPTDLLHPFERMGLGKAPFKLVGVSSDSGPRSVECSNGTTYHAGNGLRICDFCRQDIRDVFEIKSSDGKLFVVGSSCVMRTLEDRDERLARAIAAGVRKLAAAKRAAKKAAAAGQAVAQNQATLEQLAHLEERGNSFAVHFAASVRTQIAVKGKNPSDKQLALIAKLMTETK